MKALNQVAVDIPSSGIRSILDEAANYRDVVHLEIGQPDFPTPAHIIEAAHKALLDGFTGYSPNAGLPSVRKAFADYLMKTHNIEVSADQIVVTVGAMGALFNAFMATLNPGDEVLVPNPGYPNYRMAISLMHAISVPYRLDVSKHGFSLNVEHIESLITEKTKAIVLNSPSNPTGMVATSDQVEALVAVAHRHHVYLISDEAYDQMLFSARHVSPLSFDPDGNVFGMYSCSKTYSMAGWRVGFIVAPKRIAPLMAKLQEAYCSCAPTVSQKAAEAALVNEQTCVEAMREAYRQRVEYACALCEQMNIDYVRPSGAFYLMVKLPNHISMTSDDFALALVKSVQLAVAPGSTFGSQGEGFVRLSLCCSESIIKEGLQRLHKVFANPSVLR
ncbi:MAG: pyridoxal phosphate-dependent aminotransferase [Sphaerochaetaceae bacterium]